MSSFGAKRKARIIQTFDDDGDDLTPPSTTGDDEHSDRKLLTATAQPSLNCPPLLITGPSKSEQADALPAEPAPTGRVKFGRNKPAKSSALRKSININDDESLGESASAPAATAHDGGDDDESSAPAVVRPTLGRSGSTKLKKRPAASRLSFGPGQAAAEEDDDSTGEGGVTKPFTPKKPLGQRLLENNALRKSASLQNLAGSLPMRFAGQEEAPKYSKEYLEELQSSTPNTPQNLASLQIHDDGDEMQLDQSELEGALVVQSTDVAPPPPAPGTAAHILTEAEIRERKERRARLAKEADFISFDDGSEDERTQGGGGRMTINLPNKKKQESRLIAEDEDLGEGYDEFVSDGGLALGKKAERAASRRHRQEMADLIQAAEGGSDAESDDSEAERRAAYEAAQRRAGMDGLHRPPDDDHDMDGAVGPDAIPRMKPLPKLNEVLQRMREIVQGLEDEVTQKRSTIEGLEKEKQEILAREKEVQEILNQAGAKYQAVVASAGGSVGDVSKLVSQSPLRPFPAGMAGELPVERGLESFGATPTRREDVEEVT
ncbi:nineteen complex-related protein 2-domain-containing protein [Parachaetomium inaequale]|uniref:Nineteen complex-related protein 2-domain-containing protein n=1 Tax=Parachaetomium inaequale TaxID=2588326 RepID=A0AAN6STV1_9PEZI|nr:nineteen complex-related protein 2-domain-containing protein [Parachaetomium inaequale]